jgi:hypothetical protein
MSRVIGNVAIVALEVNWYSSISGYAEAEDKLFEVRTMICTSSQRPTFQFLTTVS